MWLLQLAAAVTCIAAGAMVASAHNFIGAERCKSCHEFEYKMWRQGPHATALNSLSEQEQQDAKCNSCHTLTSELLTERFQGVQCERCHGAGRYYNARYVMRDKDLARAVGLVDVDAARCQECHNTGAPSVRPFDFARMWSKIAHGKQARQAWLDARDASAQ